jgi:hypothetical protein
MLFHGTQMITIDPRWPELARSLGLEGYQSIIDCQKNPVSQTSITRVHRLNPDPKMWRGGIYLKKIIADGWYRYFLRPAKAYLEAANYRQMRKIGTPVPEVLAIGQRRFLGGLIDAFLITAGIENAVTLEEYAHEKPLAPTQEIRDISSQLAQIVRTMHQANFFHIDLQWRNILVQRNVEGIKLFLIDCPRGGHRLFYLRRRNGIMHDLAGLEKLAGLYLTSRQRLRWYKKYIGNRRFNHQDRVLLRRVQWEIEHRKQRNGS